jgi:hypothetical protein
MQRIRVRDIARPLNKDIDPNGRIDVQVVDGIVNKSCAAATEALKRPPTGYSVLQAGNISWIFDALRFTHETIRSLIRRGHTTPSCVDALALSRLQLETLYSLCLISQDPSFADDYVKSFWKDNYVRFLLVREECKNLQRFDSYLNHDGQLLLTQLQQCSGVSEEEKATVELEELGTPARLEACPCLPKLLQMSNCFSTS